MTDWEITATTVYCEAVDDEVTLIIHRDGTARCTGQQKYAGTNKDKAGLVKKRNQGKGRLAGCSGNDCPIVSRYRDSLIKPQG
jgi:hypothetical protein